MSRLHAFPTELQADEDRLEVRIALVDSADRAIVEVLDGIDGWLVDFDLDAVRVHLDQHVYTLAPPYAVER